MKQYYLDLRNVDPEKRAEIFSKVNTHAWDVYDVAGVPNLYAFMWDYSSNPVEDLSLDPHVVLQYLP